MTETTNCEEQAKELAEVMGPDNRQKLTLKQYKLMEKVYQLYSICGERHQKLPNGNYLNWDAGLLSQIKNVKDNYLEWLDHPQQGQLRLCQSDFSEGFSFTLWYLVALIYIPWSLLEFRLALKTLNNTIYIQNTEYLLNSLLNLLSNLLSSHFNFSSHLNFILTIFFCIIFYLIGVLAWTLFEYCAHRFVFHFQPPSIEYNIVHFFSHGMHHITPTDEYRLVFPLIISLPLGVLVRFFFYNVLFPSGMSSAMFGGFSLGYAIYESTHYLSHHCPKGTYLRNREKYHSLHHFSKQKKRFSVWGINTNMGCCVWDILKKIM